MCLVCAEIDGFNQRGLNLRETPNYLLLHGLQLWTCEPFLVATYDYWMERIKSNLYWVSAGTWTSYQLLMFSMHNYLLLRYTTCFNKFAHQVFSLSEVQNKKKIKNKKISGGSMVCCTKIACPTLKSLREVGSEGFRTCHGHLPNMDGHDEKTNSLIAINSNQWYWTSLGLAAFSYPHLLTAGRKASK
jgi:hypothetical protein